MPLNSNTISKDSSLSATISPFREQLKGELEDTLLYMHQHLIRSEFDSSHQNLLWNWVTDAILTYAKEELNWEINACLLNSGGLRKDIPSGPITVKDIFELMPFDNYLVKIELDENGFEEMKGYLKSKPQPSSGLIYYYSNDELYDITFSTKKATKTFVTINYLADGGDRMSFWKSGERMDSSILLRDAMIWYCKKYSEAQPAIDGRTKLLAK